MDIQLLQKLNKKIVIKSIIEEGAFGQVLLGQENDVPVAVKVIPLQNRNCKKHATKEKKILKYLRECDPEALQLYSYTKIKTNGETYSVFSMERMDGDLLSIIEQNHQPEEIEVKRVFKLVCEAVLRLHNLGIAHLDLKLDNILYRRDRPESERNNIQVVKLCDFGFSQRFKKSDRYKFSAKKPFGTPQYRAPEVSLGTSSEVSLLKVDVFSLGVILFALLTSNFPFSIEGEVKYCNTGLLNQYSETVRDLVLGMLNEKPSERPSVSEILNHKWFQ